VGNTAHTGQRNHDSRVLVRNPEGQKPETS